MAQGAGQVGVEHHGQARQQPEVLAFVVRHDQREQVGQAAIGRAQLERLPGLIAERRRLAARYATLLADVSGVTAPAEPARARSNWQSYCVRLANGVYQHPVMQALLDRGISSRRGVMCAHTEPAYATQPWRRAGALRESERATHDTLILPLYPGMADDDQQYVVDALADVCAARVAIRACSGAEAT